MPNRGCLEAKRAMLEERESMATSAVRLRPCWGRTGDKHARGLEALECKKAHRNGA